MSVTIRPYTPQDRNACLEIFNSNCPDYLDPSEIEGFKIWLDGLDIGEVRYKTSSADYFYVLLRDSKIIACGGFYCIKNKPHANMAWGMVHKSNHKQGYGKQLFEYRLQQINKQYPGYAIYLDTSQHTYPFFQQFGFSVDNITKDGYGPGLHRYDMQKD